MSLAKFISQYTGNEVRYSSFATGCQLLNCVKLKILDLSENVIAVALLNLLIERITIDRNILFLEEDDWSKLFDQKK